VTTTTVRRCGGEIELRWFEIAEEQDAERHRRELRAATLMQNYARRRNAKVWGRGVIK